MSAKKKYPLWLGALVCGGLATVLWLGLSALIWMAWV